MTRDATIVAQEAPQLWSALFNVNTFVRPHTPDNLSLVVGSYPTARLHDLVKTVYQDTIVDSPLEPPIDALPSALAPLLPLFGPASDDGRGTHGSDDDARAELAREIFRPSSGDLFRAKLDQLVDLAIEEASRRCEQ